MSDKTREIKFRAWDGSRMSEGKTIDNLFQQNEDWFGNRIHIVDRFVPQNDCILMQFTGLHDKYGKEIYEGDVVRHEKWVSVGKYAPAIGVVKYKCVSFTCECIGDWVGANADLNGLAEVIGNIYENPELLNA